MKERERHVDRDFPSVRKRRKMRKTGRGGVGVVKFFCVSVKRRG